MPGGGDMLPCPGALPAQRNRVRGHRAQCPPPGHVENFDRITEPAHTYTLTARSIGLSFS
jgi:hypothetical protein